MSYIDKVKNALVIGGNGTIGQAMIEQLLSYTNIEKIYVISRAGITSVDNRMISLQGSIEDAEFLEQLPTLITVKLDLVLIATGILTGKNYTPEKKYTQIHRAGLEEVFSVNTFAPILVLAALDKVLNFKQLRVGVLSAKVGSIADNYLGGWYGYRASKSALNMLIKSLAIEWSRYKTDIAILALHPGTVDSPLSKPFQANIAKQQLKSSSESAAHLLNIIDNSTQADSGKLFSWTGEVLPY